MGVCFKRPWWLLRFVCFLWQRVQDPGGTIWSRNPKEHVMIVTGTIGYVIVVVESIGHAVVLLEEFWSLCTASWTEPSFGDLL